MRKTTALAVVVGSLASAAAAAPFALSAVSVSGKAATHMYVVQLAEKPAAGYSGGLAGYAATRPAHGAKLRTASPAVQQYSSYLKGRHAAVAAHVPGVQRVYDYTAAFNGFAARLTAEQAAKLERTSGVLSVTQDEQRVADTITTPTFLGLSAPGGLWEQLGGTGRNGAGRGIVVGIIDSGIWPESGSFAKLAKPGKLSGFGGACQTGEQFDASDCSNKIVSARFYDAGQGGDDAIHVKFPTEYVSPRDANGHGSHTASTAAGDFGTPVVIIGNHLGDASGMAPNARIAVYKALWNTGSSATGTTSDLVAAIDDATSDGVDVINYSISGSLSSDVDPVEVAFLFAADAGVFVSASAGNSGPTSSTVAHNSPWLTTAAAGTHDRAFRGTVNLGNGASYTGAGIGAAVPSSTIALSSSLGLAGASATGVRLCFSREWDPAHPEGFLDPAQVAGKIVVCDRGTNDRVDKSRAVAEAGGVGMVLANTSPNSLNVDFHSVPTVHVNDIDGGAIKAYVSGTPSPTASLGAGQPVLGVRAPMVAAFSSRGPALAGSGDLLKPDIMAPGVDVLAAVAPPNHGGRDFDFESGTSMSAPHIAGVAALIKQRHPGWSPMAIKSALMTTAATTDNTGAAIVTDSGGAAGAFDYGSGEVTPNSAVDPGLVYDSGFVDWIRFLCGSGQLSASGSTCNAYGSIDPSDLNTPNVAIGGLAGVQTVTRTVTNVGRRASYFPHVTPPAGVDVSVSPSVLTLRKGESASYTVTFTRTTAPFGSYTAGSLTWSDGRHSVRSQLVVKPVPVSAPAEIRGTGTSGSTDYSVTAGFAGTLTTTPAGLVAGNVNSATLTSPTGGSFPVGSPVASDHTAKFTVAVPAGTTRARFATFDSDVPAGTDLDMFVFRAGTATLVGQSAGGTAQEQVDLANPTGSYDVYVDLFALAPGETSQLVNAFDWELGSASAGNLSATPASTSVTTGQVVPVTASWSGLTSGTRYLGRISYGDGVNTLGSTLVRVDG